MLQLLHIENIAIIECADIEFRPGFNALTGETGAGKSIVIDSISAVLGQRTSRDLIRTGANMAFVSACFTDISPRLGEDLGIAWEGELLLQREIHGDGKNVCRVNGRPVTVTQLRTLGSRLLNIHGQHDGQQLLDEEQHLSYLDRFGRTEAPLGRYQAAYEAMADLQAKIRALQMDEAGPAAERGEVPLRPVGGGLLPERRGGGRRRRLRPPGRGGGPCRCPHALRRHGGAVPAPGTAAV